ncbi:hypothetical protein [Winogradskyella sp. 3972H.M.0a.05]|uniref:hypothetical protein n=1 Tax=Winogradskyella sp. 3972H.M.0a.05 TaxID=2950277 RepID=UPI003392169D
MSISSFFYNTKVLSKDEITIDTDEIVCDDIGLYVIGQYPQLEFNYVSVFPKKEWKKIASETISLAFLNLIQCKAIKLHKFTHKDIYVGGLYSREVLVHYFEVLNTENIPDDLFSETIIKLINETESKYGNHKKLWKVLKRIGDFYLGENKEYSRPEKRYVIEIIKQYTKKHEWINLESEPKLMGIYKDYKINIKPIYIPRIKMQHEAIKELHLNQKRTNPKYKIFVDNLVKRVNSDFTRRYPSDNDPD